MGRWFLVLVLSTGLMGCEPDVHRPEMIATVVALFDPLATPPVVPTPNDLAFVGGDGTHLNVQNLPTDSAAQQELNAYLNTLDGFPTSSTSQAFFSGPLNPATVSTPSASAAGSVLVFDLTAASPLPSPAVTAALAPDGSTIDITPAQRWTPGHRFAVLIFGGSDANGVRGANGVVAAPDLGPDPLSVESSTGAVAIASPTFFLLRASQPLVALCPDPVNPKCVCADPTSLDCHSLVAGVDDATARAAEVQRRMIDPVLTPLIPPNRSRNNVILFWTFTITTAPETVFDPASGQVPFPNDVLLDPNTGLVNLPIAAGDPQAALKMQLNTLDGFSTSAPITTPIDLVAGAAVDQASLLPGQTVVLINLDPRAGAPQPLFSAASPPTGPIALTPIDALESDQDRYAMVVTDLVTVSGQPLRPDPTTVLVTGAAPLFAEGKSTVSELSDAQAQQLEQLRLAYQPLIAQLDVLGLTPHIAALSVFTTQSIARPLVAMAEFPGMAGLTTSTTLTTVADQATLATKPLLFPTANLSAMILGTFTTELVVNPISGQITFTRTATMPGVPQADTFSVSPPPTAAVVTIPFWLSLPKTAAPGGAPVVILQHGLGGWRGDMVIFADAFAQLGWAAIAFDLPAHGARSLCTADSQCNGGCDIMTQQCNGGFVPEPLSMDPLACSLEALSGDANDCNPAASGAALVGPNLFFTRSIGQQYVLDGAQLLRVITSGISAQLPSAVDRSHVGFLGVSLGAIAGTLLEAAVPQPDTAALIVGGGHLFEIIATGDLSVLLDPLLAAFGVQQGTPEFAQLEATADWVLDAADPFSVGPLVLQRPIVPGTKRVILQVAGLDTVVPTQFGLSLARQLFGPAGLDEAGHAQGHLVNGTPFSTFFADAVHTTVLTGMPAPTAAAMRAQALTFVTSSGTAQ